jgi:acetyl-CoA C-acetyltransferase
MREVVIIDGVRTPIGRMGGSLSSFRAEELFAIVLRGLLDKTGVGPDLIDDVYMGAAITSRAINAARWAVLKAGFPYSVPAMGVERQCGSGLQTIALAAQAIMSGEADVVIAGGAESWSTVPFMLARYSEPKPFSLTPPAVFDRETGPGPLDFTMGMTAENLAEKYQISREEQDSFSLESQRRALRAAAEGRFAEEIIEVSVPQKRGEALRFEADEHPRETTLEKLSALPAVFKDGGTVTAGSSSGLNDGAVALLVMSRQRADQLGLKPLGRYLATSVVGVDPAIMGIGPAFAIPKVLKKTGLAWQDISVIECNEAFAAQTLAVVKELERSGYKVDMQALNPNGGAIALGHPNGASGGRLALSLLRELRRRKSRFGIASLCIGGGQGVATVFEAL